GKARNMHPAKRREKIQGRGPTGKVVVMGMLQRGGKVRTAVIANRDKETLHEHVQKNVRKGSNVFTDELVSYWGLNDKSSTTPKSTCAGMSILTAWRIPGVY